MTVPNTVILLVHIGRQIHHHRGLDRAERIRSGQPRYINRVNRVLMHLKDANAISSPARGMWQITDEGRRLLTKYPVRLSEAELRVESGEGYARYAQPSQVVAVPALCPVPGDHELIPLERVEAAQCRNEELIAEGLLECLLDREPAYFEQAVLGLLMAMGYRGSFGTTPRTQLLKGGGVDGTIDHDTLGLSRIYVHAKRYAPGNRIGRADVQSFVGALHGAQASQGVFLTTGVFSSGAQSYADSVPTRVVLIDGPLLAQLMIRHGIGVRVKRNIQIIEVDEDYFE